MIDGANVSFSIAYGLTLTPDSLLEARIPAGGASTVSVGGTATLGGTQVPIDKDLTIDASSLPGGLTIDAADSSRIFDINPGTPTVTLDSLTLENGAADDGGGIRNLGTLILRDCTIRGCSATGLGGGLFNDNGGTVTLERCTLSANDCDGDGGGIANQDGGAATTLHLHQSTLSGNSAADEGGGIWNSGVAVIRSSTISENISGGAGSGIQSVGVSADLTVENSILAGNTGGTDLGGTIDTPLGSNLVGGSPLLAPLGNHGGPTRTMIPLPASPAIDASATTPFLSDQRGYWRVVGTAADIGAVEVGPTLAWWRFEDGPADTEVVHNDPSAGVFSADIPDRSGQGNDLAVWTTGGGTGYAYRSDTPLPDVPGAGAVNQLSVQNTGDFPAMFTSPTGDLQGITPQAWTIEAAFKPEASGSFRTLVGRDSQGANTANVPFDANLAALYLQITDDDRLAIKFCDEDGYWHEALSAPGLVPGFDSGSDPGGSSGQWQAAAAVSDGTTLRLYHRNFGAGDAAYTLVATADLGASGSTDTRLTAGSGSGPDWTAGAWSVGELLIDKSLTIDASTLADGLTVDASGVPRAFLVTSTGVTLGSLHVIGGNTTDGAGILNAANAGLTVRNSTVSAGTVTGVGGGLVNSGSGSTATLNHCTVAGNYAGDNGGGIRNVAELHLNNTIVAGNSAGGASLDLSNSGGGGVSTRGVNLLSSLGGSSLSAGSSVIVGDPMLAPLDGYGGPTETRPLLPGSPALDAAGSTDPGGSDQRGFPRFVNGALDMGAVEVGQVTVLNNTDSGAGSLRQAIADATNFSIIDFAEPLSGDSILLGTELLINKDLIIDASALASPVTLDAQQNSRVIHIGSGGHTVTLDSLVITGGRTPDATGGDATHGGGIFNDGGTLTIARSTITGNATGDGASSISIGTIDLANSTLSGNSCGAGGLAGAGPTPGVNGAAGNGGGLFKAGGTLAMSNTLVAENLASPDTNLAGSIDSGTHNLTSGDPLLAPLGDYGGPTPTRPPLPGSPAIEGGTDTGSLPATDQIGNPRVAGPLPDIGSVEALPLALLSLADSDDDGIPDVLEGPGGPYPHLVVRSSPDTIDAALDTDSDGRTDAQEIASMTDLFDPDDFFRILSIGPAPGFDTDSGVQVTLPTFPGLHYGFEYGDLKSPYVLHGPSIEATGYETTIEVDLDPSGFLRAYSSSTPVVEPP